MYHINIRILNGVWTVTLHRQYQYHHYNTNVKVALWASSSSFGSSRSRVSIRTSPICMRVPHQRDSDQVSEALPFTEFMIHNILWFPIRQYTTCTDKKILLNTVTINIKMPILIRIMHVTLNQSFFFFSGRSRILSDLDTGFRSPSTTVFPISG